MKAVVIVPGQTCGALCVREVDTPAVQPGELLIRIRAAALNRADIFLRDAATLAAHKDVVSVAGMEVAGEVAAVGAGVRGFAAGDRVMSMCVGGFAEYVAVDHRFVLRVPERLSWEEAASIPISFLTEYDALVANAQLKPGESVLITAASAGTGVAAVQLAAFFGAAQVIGTSGSSEKLEQLTALGLTAGINYRKQSIPAAVMGLTGERGVNIVLDHIGTAQFDNCMHSLALNGRLITIGRMSGTYYTIDLDFVSLRRLRLIGVTFRTRTGEERAEISRCFTRDVLPALADGRLRPVVDRVFPLDEAVAAQAYLESGMFLGKIVLSI